MALEFGTLQGLAAQVDFNAKFRMAHAAQQEERQQHIEQQAQAKMLSDDMKFDTPMNAFDAKLVSSHANGKIDEMISLLNDNGGYANISTDVNLMRKYNQIQNDIKNSQFAKNGIMNDANYTAWQKDLAEKSKYPELMNKKEYERIETEWRNFQATGSILGAEDYAKNGYRGFTYNAPRDFSDLDKVASAAGDSFKDFTVERSSQYGHGGYKNKINEKSLGLMADNIYKLHQDQLDQFAASAGYNDGKSYMKELIRAKIPEEIKMGQFFAADFENKGGSADGGGGSTYNIDFKNQEKGKANPEALKDAFGNIPFSLRPKGGTPINQSEKDWMPTGLHAYIDGVKNLQFDAVYTEDEAKELGIINDPYFFGEPEPTAAYKDRVQPFPKTSKDGSKTIMLYKYTDWMPIDVDSEYAKGVYDSKTTPVKYRDAPDGRIKVSKETLPEGTTQAEIDKINKEGIYIIQ